MKINLILPTYNNYELTLKCLETIKKYEDPNYEVNIIWIDNNSNFDDISFEYFNLPMNNFDFNMDRPMEVLEPKVGLSLGNMYKDEYKPYKNYMQKRITVNNDREKMLLKIQVLKLFIESITRMI